MIQFNLNKSSAASNGRHCVPKRAAALITAALIVAAVLLFTGCPQTASGSGGSSGSSNAGASSGGGSPGSGGSSSGGGSEKAAVLTLAPGQTTIRWILASTADNSPITVEGCTETELPNGREKELHPTGTTVILKGNITSLQCYSAKLIALDVQSLSDLKQLYCNDNQFTELNLQGLTKLETLWCDVNQLTSLNVQGLKALKYLKCSHNKFDAEAFTKLLTDLPERKPSDEARCVLYSEVGGDDKNYNKFGSSTTPKALKEAFKKAKKKNWKLNRITSLAQYGPA